MANFLNTAGVNQHLEKLIKNTRHELILISPYLQFSENIKSCLKKIMIDKPDIRIVYRTDKLNDNERNWLGSQVGLRTSYCPDLHAKCYLNEQEAIITSMNLYEHSQLNNSEMGIYFNTATDKQLYSDTYQEAKRLIKVSKEVRLEADKVNGKEKSKNGSKHVYQKSFGYCIRTGVQIPFNIDKPLSPEAYRSWSKHEDYYYPEKYCHLTGEASHGATCYDKPVLKKNWDMAQAMMDDY